MRSPWKPSLPKAQAAAAARRSRLLRSANRPFEDRVDANPFEQFRCLALSLGCRTALLFAVEQNRRPIRIGPTGGEWADPISTAVPLKPPMRGGRRSMTRCADL
jgi:hypothetical protein